MALRTTETMRQLSRERGAEKSNGKVQGVEISGRTYLETMDRFEGLDGHGMAKSRVRSDRFQGHSTG